MDEFIITKELKDLIVDQLMASPQVQLIGLLQNLTPILKEKEQKEDKPAE